MAGVTPGLIGGFMKCYPCDDSPYDERPKEKSATELGKEGLSERKPLRDAWEGVASGESQTKFKWNRDER